MVTVVTGLLESNKEPTFTDVIGDDGVVFAVAVGGVPDGMSNTACPLMTGDPIVAPLAGNRALAIEIRRRFRLRGAEIAKGERKAFCRRNGFTIEVLGYGRGKVIVGGAEILRRIEINLQFTVGERCKRGCCHRNRIAASRGRT